MKATGIVRRIDDLGRVVIPKEIRRTMTNTPAPYSMTTDSAIMLLFILNIIGISYVILMNGTSIIENIEQIDRGYQNIDIRLRALGAEIERVD